MNATAIRMAEENMAKALVLAEERAAAGHIIQGEPYCIGLAAIDAEDFALYVSSSGRMKSCRNSSCEMKCSLF